MNSLPAHQINGVAYLKESAAIGHLEPVRISGVHAYGSGWVYSVSFTPVGSLSNNTVGDRRTLLTGTTVYYSEDELLTYCAAVDLAAASAKAVYDRLASLKATICSAPTGLTE